MKLSFLGSAHGVRAVKAFTNEGMRQYPLIKHFNSTEYEIDKTSDGLLEQERLIRLHASRGDCMLKGFLKRPLASESRAGAVDSEAMTENLILDVDGIILPGFTLTDPPLTRSTLQAACEEIIRATPPPFQNVSYIAHTSSSMGLKGQSVSMHIQFWLSEPVSPRALKEYVTYLNFHVPLFAKNLSLTASGTALSYGLDRSVVDNSHIIYIGTPEFGAGIANPIPDENDRIFLVSKGSLVLYLGEEIEKHADSSKNRANTTKYVNNLRAAQGMPPHKEKTQAVTIDGRRIHVVTNPESCTMTFAADNGDFVAYNVNGGDSAAYYVLKHKPQIVRNFKGEPSFLFEIADPEAYQKHLEQFVGQTTGEKQAGKVTPIPMVFRDEASNAYYNALLDTRSGQLLKIAKAARDGLPDWMVQYEGVMPENVPIWNFEFNPQREQSVDFRDRFVNKYIPSEYMSQETDMPRGYLTPLDYDSGFSLDTYCPIIAEVLFHVVGRDVAVFNHFLNWLAAAIQCKDKLSTAWILQGTQGTGKGIFFDNILAPLVGHGIGDSQPYAAKVRLENIEDQFNQWMECALFVAFDEFRLEDSMQSKKLFNKIKSMISEPTEPIRGMRENMRSVRTFTNYLFFSNDKDVTSIPTDDRRFNVAPRQEIKLSVLFDDLHNIVKMAIPQELGMFAQILKDYDVDFKKARTPLENAAKDKMRTLSQTTIEEFVAAVRQGDLEYFIPVLDMPFSTGQNYLMPAQAIIKAIIRDTAVATMHKMSTDELRYLYNVMVGKSENVQKFGKLMSRMGLDNRNIRIGGKIVRGYAIHWGLSDNSIETLQQIYLSDADLQFGDDPKVRPLLRAID